MNKFFSMVLHTKHMPYRIFTFSLFSLFKLTTPAYTILENLCLDNRKNKCPKFFKKPGILGLCMIFFSCNDGDLQIETLDFNSVSMQTCNTTASIPIVAIDENAVLFKLNADEGLILNLPANSLKNEIGTATIEITADTPSKIIYRIFSATVTTAYFCDEIPPIAPTVIDEIIASKALIKIVTTANEPEVETGDITTYSHEITIEEITLETGKNQRITDLTLNDFGTIQTIVPNENIDTNETIGTGRSND